MQPQCKFTATSGNQATITTRKAGNRFAADVEWEREASAADVTECSTWFVNRMVELLDTERLVAVSLVEKGDGSASRALIDEFLEEER